MIEHVRQRRAGRRVGEIVAIEQRSRFRASGGGDRRQGIGVSPRAHDDHGEAGRVFVCEVLPGALAQRVDDTGKQDGALADAARAVQKREPRAEEVRLDDLLFRLPSEEEGGVRLRVRP